MKVIDKTKLALWIAACSALPSSCITQLKASDIEIYQNAAAGQTTLLMMLDTSGSMGYQSIYDDNTALGLTSRNCPVTTESASVTYNGVNYSYGRQYCTYNRIKYYDRMSRLKDALMTSFSNQSLSNSLKIGLGQYSSKVSSTSSSVDGISGRVVVPSKALDSAQRATLLNAVKDLQAYGGTPTAAAYAEAGAYMMGTIAGGYANDVLARDALARIYVTSNNSDPLQKQVDEENTALYFKCESWYNSDKPDYITSTNPPTVNAGKNISTGRPGATNKYLPINPPSIVAYTEQCDINPWDNGWTYQRLKDLPVGQLAGSWRKLAGYEDLDTLDAPNKFNYTGFSGQFFIQNVDDAIRPVDLNASSGFKYSVDSAKNATKTAYVSPLPSPPSTCNGNGIYFLTDGYPNATQTTTATSIMKQSLTKIGFTPTFSCSSALANTNTGSSWQCIGSYAQALNDPTKNPSGSQIKTAVVGFGNVFSSAVTNGSVNCNAITDGDVKNACLWGQSADYGQGGFYYANNTADITNSLNNFVRSLTPNFSEVTTGSPTLPQDALNPLRIQPYGYYASFKPKPNEMVLPWIGNLNKYHVKNGELYDVNKSVPLITADGSLNTSANGIWTGGVQGQLPYGMTASTTNRKVLTNRVVATTSPYTASTGNTLQQVTVDNLMTTGAFLNDPAKVAWLNILGYPVTSTTGLTASNLPTAQANTLGAVMHSTPILLTQSGTITVDANGNLDTTSRVDYLLYGSTQGVLHVIDASNGKEKFAFIPNDMIEARDAAFTRSGGTASDTLFYGIDGPWTAFTQYVSKSDGSVTVNDSGRTTEGNIALKGLQWVYGGLRMGGRSYYSLDLTNVESPTIKFQIDPANKRIIKSSATVSADALQYMGQSWSKPTIAYVNFNGVKKPVMIVGGGYDTGYESPSYNQSSKIGAGVYMFDANTGDLLWWGSANATANMGATTSTNNADLKYSVVSQINAVDRNGDGLVDHLYFGDLGGQVFRIDLDNTATTAAGFVKRVAKLYGETKTDGTNPRFYEMPSFSIYNGIDGKFGVVALASGNRSSPLAGAIGSNNPTATASAVDGVYAIYDNDVARSDLYTTTALRNNATALRSFDSTNGVAQKSGTIYNTGWKYAFSTKAGEYKGMSRLYAVDSILFANVFSRDTGNTSGACGSGVKGETYAYQFCLPDGKCAANFYPSGTVLYPSGTSGAVRTKIGSGLLGTGLTSGGGNGGNGNDLIKVLVPNPDVDCTVSSNANLPACIKFTTKPSITSLRWYELK